MRFVVTIITCPDRADLLKATLASLDGAFANADPKRNGISPVIICMDESRAERRQDRQVSNSFRALELALAQKPEMILFLEDDVEINPHLFHNLAHWKPLVQGWFGMASLYNPNIRELERGLDWFRADPNAVYGSQGFLLTAPCARYCLEHWAEVPGMQDIKLSRLADKGAFRIFYHRPSLVQHVGRVSTFGGQFHFTADYDGAYRAPGCACDDNGVPWHDHPECPFNPEASQPVISKESSQ